MGDYPKIKAVTPLSDKRLRVTFVTGDIKVYDCSPLLAEETFGPLEDEVFFRNVYADRTGYGIVWTDNIDLSEAELWLHGVEE